MIPMIDLLMVTISFLLITAVWTHMARINADAQVPGPPRPDVEQEKTEPEKQLHVEMQRRGQVRPRLEAGEHGRSTRSTCPARTSSSHEGSHRSRPLPRPRREDRERVEGQGPALATRRDKKLDQAILHTDNKTEFTSTSSASSTRSTSRTATCNLGRQDREGAGVQRHLRGQLREHDHDDRTSPAAA